MLPTRWWECGSLVRVGFLPVPAAFQLVRFLLLLGFHLDVGGEEMRVGNRERSLTAEAEDCKAPRTTVLERRLRPRLRSHIDMADASIHCW